MDLRNKILAAGIVLQIAVLAVVFWPESEGPPPEPLLQDVSATDIAAITITDSRGRQIRLAKGGDGCVMPDADDFPCNAEQLTSLIDRAVAVTTGNLVTKTPDSHRRLQVHTDEFLRLIEIEQLSGAKQKMYLGSSPRPRASHVRADGDDTVYVTSDLADFDVPSEAVSWIETRYFTVPERDVVSITLENENGTFDLRKDEDGNWSMVGLEADEEFRQVGLDALLNRATKLDVRRPLGKSKEDSYGLNEPAALVTVQTSAEGAPNGTYTIEIGIKDPDDFQGRLTKYSRSQYYVMAPAWTVAEFTGKKREDFIVQPPATITIGETPTPTSTTTPAGG